MKAGEHKGVKIFLSDIYKTFSTNAEQPTGFLTADSYKDIVKQIDAKLEEKEKATYKDFIQKYAGCNIYTDNRYYAQDIYYYINLEGKKSNDYSSIMNTKRAIDIYLAEKELKPMYESGGETDWKYINDLVGKFAGTKTYENVTFDNCVFNMPKGYDKLSAEQKTLIDNLIKNLNEKE